MFERYYKSCKARGLSEQTIKTYKNGLAFFERYLTENNIELKNITKEDVEDLIIWLDNGKRNKRTIQSHMITIRTYLYYEMEQESIDIPFKIKINRCESKLKEIYTESELLRLLEKPNKKKCNFTEYKIWVFENYLLGTGNRLNSVLNIKNKDVDLDTGYIVLRHTKNKKQQYVPLSSSLINILEEYMNIRGGTNEDYLFCSTIGTKADTRTYQQQVSKYNQNRNVEKTSIHLFRHTFASIYMKNGGEIYRLSKLLGHSNIGITEHYIHTLPIELSLNYDENNPLESLIQKSHRTKIRMR